jgi:hypothetical protein
MASKQDNLRKLHAHRKRGTDLIASWAGARDEKAARDFHDTEKNKWLPKLLILVRNFDPTLVSRYESHLSPFEYPGVGSLSLNLWPDVNAGFNCLVERVSRLRDDVDTYAREHGIDLSVDEPIVPSFITKEQTESAYSQYVIKTRKETGKGPTSKSNDAWAKNHGLSRKVGRELRSKSPDRDEKDKKGGRPKLAKK